MRHTCTTSDAPPLCFSAPPLCITQRSSAESTPDVHMRMRMRMHMRMHRHRHRHMHGQMLWHMHCRMHWHMYLQILTSSTSPPPLRHLSSLPPLTPPSPQAPCTLYLQPAV
mmetsp:Transcript_3154/g.6785  ORF Transcript_3154/g.6785 Transcript_3154/m.6785 type:complete len:111 (-) Transcript_3154:1685-2017(-)